MRTEADSDGPLDARTDGGSDLKARFERAIRGLQKPKTAAARRPLSPITIQETKERLFLVEQCARLGMSVEHMAEFLPTWGLKLSRSTLYEYLQQLKLPRSYSPSMTGQSHHDYYTLGFFIRIAQDAAAAGYKTRKLLKGRLAWEGARFRPDFKFEVDRYLFFMEMQLSDLTETRWSVKFSNYWRLREDSGLRFRALFVIDQRGDLAYVRRAARAFQERKGEPDANLFLFICLDDMKGSANVATDQVWLTPSGKRQSLLLWLRRPGQKPTVQCKR